MLNNNKVLKDDYNRWIKNVVSEYRRLQIKAASAVNIAMLEFYYNLGKDIILKEAEKKYGSGFYKRISKDLINNVPDSHSFSVSNIRYMVRFYKMLNNQKFPQTDEKLKKINVLHNSRNIPQLGEELRQSTYTEASIFSIFNIPWGHIKLIIDKFSDNIDKAIFYALKTNENNWSRAVLMNFINTDLYEREGKAISNFEFRLPKTNGDLAQEMTRDPYNFDFLSIREKYDEKELKDALMDNIQKFLLELGSGFAFVGKEYRLEVGKTEQFLDMLFYNINLRCYVVIEVKIRDFKSEDIGQLGTYVSCVNHILKKDNDNQTIGLLICKSKDNVLAKYSVESSNEPIAISEYELSKLYPKNFKSSMPTIEEIENSLSGEIL